MLRRTKRTHFEKSAVGSLSRFARIRKCRWRRRPAVADFVPVGSVRASGEARRGQTVDHAAHHLSDCLRLRRIGPFGTHVGSRVRSSPVGEELPARYGRAHLCWVPEDGANWRQPPSNSASTCRSSQIRDGTPARALGRRHKAATSMIAGFAVARRPPAALAVCVAYRHSSTASIGKLCSRSYPAGAQSPRFLA